MPAEPYGDQSEDRQEKLYRELGLEYLQRRRWYRNFAHFIRFLKKTNQFTFLI